MYDVGDVCCIDFCSFEEEGLRFFFKGGRVGVVEIIDFGIVFDTFF